jgi:hypothetical protein
VLAKIAIPLVILLLTLPAVSQHSGKSIMGQVVDVTSNSITVQTKDRSQQEVILTSQTAYQKNGATAAFTDVKIGDRVVVQADQNGETLTANSVRFRTEMRLDRRNMKYRPKAEKEGEKQGASPDKTPK